MNLKLPILTKSRINYRLEKYYSVTSERKITQIIDSQLLLGRFYNKILCFHWNTIKITTLFYRSFINFLNINIYKINHCLKITKKFLQKMKERSNKQKKLV